MSEATKAIEATLRGFFPVKRPSIADWAKSHMMTDDGTPYSQENFPHLAAPNGPFDAVDDRRVRNIWVMFASQLGKTFFGQTMTAYFADVAPSNQLFASANKKLAKEVIERYYDCIDHMPILRDRLPPEHRRRAEQVDLAGARMYVAWSRSVPTLSDKAIKYGHANELDKWEHLSTSTEADPLKLFQDRGKRYHHTKKYCFEGTPSLKNASRIERGYQHSDSRIYHVPCPHCHEYQRLLFGDGKTPYGVKFDTAKVGKVDPSLARKTARYRCASCQKPINNHHRRRMMARGVWAPDGCEVDGPLATRWFDGKLKESNSRSKKLQSLGLKLLKGHPTRPGSDAGFHLSTLYALSVDWSDIAEEFAGCVGDAQLLRNFINQWLAETWELRQREQSWEKLGERIIAKGDHSIDHGVAPRWAAFLTCGVDRQADHCVFVVKAWGPERRNHTLDYGVCASMDELLDRVIRFQYVDEDGEPMMPALTLVDAGWLPDQIHDTCDQWREAGYWVIPCRGTDHLMSMPVRLTEIKSGANEGRGIVFVDSFSTQTWLDRQLYELKYPAPGSMSLFTAPLIEHRNYLAQLMNEMSVINPGRSRGTRVESWSRVDESTPNDYRDCERYAFAAMLIACGGVPIRPGDRFPGGITIDNDGPRVVGSLNSEPPRGY